MNLLITDLGDQIKDEEVILQEVYRFYNELFKSQGESDDARAT